MHKHFRLLFFIACMAIGNLFFFTSKVNAMKDYTAEELKLLIDSGQPVFLLNPLSEIEFNESHIQGSVNIPMEQLNETDKLPDDRHTLIVTYCKGPN